MFAGDALLLVHVQYVLAGSSSVSEDPGHQTFVQDSNFGRSQSERPRTRERPSQAEFYGCLQRMYDIYFFIYFPVLESIK